MISLSRSLLPLWLGVVLLVPGVVAGQTFGQPTSQALPMASPDDQREIRELLQRYNDAYVRKDLPSLEAMWHPQGTARYLRNLIDLEFETYDTIVRDLAIYAIGVDGAVGRASTTIDRLVVNRKTKVERRERRVRDYALRKDQDGHWKMYSEAPATSRLSRRVMEAAKDQRAVLLESEPELVSDDTITGLFSDADYARTKFDMTGALDVLSVAADVARKLQRDSALGKSLMDAALILHLAGQFPKAEMVLVDACAAFRTAQAKEEIPACDANLGNARYAQQKYDEAREDFQRALTYYEKSDDQARLASVLHAMGNVRYMQGDFEGAFAQYDRGLGILIATGDRYGASSLNRAMAMVHKELGNYPQAIEAYKRAAVLSAEVKDLVGTAQALHGGGEIYRLLGDFGQALQQFTLALAEWGKTLDFPNKATTQFAIGQVCAQQRQFTRALEWYRSALDSDLAGKDEAGQARDFGGIGGAQFALGQPKLAIEQYLKSLELREKLKDKTGVMWTLVHMGVAQEALGTHADALATYDRALAMATSQRDGAAMATTQALRGTTLLATNDLAGALDSATTSVATANALSRFDVVAYASVVAGKTQRLMAKPEEARQSFQAAVDAVAKVPVGPGVETFFDDRRGPFIALADLESEQQHFDEALLWAERGRLAVLAAQLGGDGAVVTKGMTDEEKAGERRIAKEIRTTTVKLSRERQRVAPVQDRIDELSTALTRLGDERAALRERLFAAHADLKWQRAQAGAPPLESLASVLADAKTALVAFTLLDAHGHVFVVRRSENGSTPAVQHALVDMSAADLASRLATVRSSLSEGQDSDKAREVYDAVFAPAAPFLSGITRLVIVPDWNLWSVPFEALKGSNGRYLVEQFAMSYAPSLTWLVHQPSSRASTPRKLFAVAAPTLTKGAIDRLAVLSTSKAVASPATDANARSLALVFGPTRSHVAAGTKASLAELTGPSLENAALHLEVPAVLSDGSPLFSTWAMAPDPRSPGEEGLAEVSDLFSWSLPAAALAFPLSEVGSGTTGDAVTMAAWAAQVAGVPSVWLSRWGTTKPAPRAWSTFYVAWSASTAGQPRPDPAVAMQRAIKRLLALPKPASPREWAGIMVVGR